MSKIVSEYDQEIPQSQTAHQIMLICMIKNLKLLNHLASEFHHF